MRKAGKQGGRGKSNLVLSRNKLPCFVCKKLTHQRKIMLTQDRKIICQNCYIPKLKDKFTYYERKR
ncbi:MAG: hypothetical protein I3273_04020 [Candidatus Moeniiplasma glomeromycotorum]|nr:hypothetical protein [Candidatus Moeniiplasma glomeromycotorum]